jgi:hypothetical protein
VINPTGLLRFQVTDIVIGTLHSTTPGSDRVPGAGGRGCITFAMPSSQVPLCTFLQVTLDADHTWQNGATRREFDNDTAMLRTPCLEWNADYHAATFGAPVSPNTEGKSLAAIVGSFVSGRSDGVLCSHCHYTGAMNPYRPNVTGDASATIYADGYYQDDVMRRWWGDDSWTDRFLTYHENLKPAAPDGYKPADLRTLVKTWIDSGRIPN